MSSADSGDLPSDTIASAFTHPAPINPTDAMFVLGAAIFTSLLTEGMILEF
jgi:hypothetical protein